MEFRNGMGMQHEDENENIYEPVSVFLKGIDQIYWHQIFFDDR